MAQPWYCTREQVKSALDFAETARNNTLIDRAIGAASRTIEALTHRRFYPYDGIRYFGYPKRDSQSWRLWLTADELVSVSTLTAGGTAISSTDYFLEPVNVGPPYTSIEIDQSSSATFAGGDTWQRSIAVTGTFGYWDEQETVGELADALDADESDTATVTWSDPQGVGVGSILKVNDERLIVTGRSFVDSTQDTDGALAASAADVTIGVADVIGFFVGEIIRVDSERCLVVDIASNSLVVKRAWDGSVLAAHGSSTEIYGLTGIEIARAELGSTLAAHVSTDVVYRYVVPPLIQDLCIAEAVVQLQQEQAGYPRSVSGGDSSVTQPAGAGLRALREQVIAGFGRKARHMAV